MGAGERRRRIRHGNIKIISTNYDHPKRAAVATMISQLLVIFIMFSFMIGIALTITFAGTGAQYAGFALLGVAAGCVLVMLLLCFLVIKPTCCFPGRVKPTAVGPDPNVTAQIQPTQYGLNPAPYNVQYTQPPSYLHPAPPPAGGMATYPPPDSNYPPQYPPPPANGMTPSNYPPPGLYN